MPLISRRSKNLPSESDGVSPLVDVGTIVSADDGSNILAALANKVEHNSPGSEYPEQLRRAAHAIREITSLHRDEPGPTQQDIEAAIWEHENALRYHLIDRK